jgi:hypothetical protein
MAGKEKFDRAETGSDAGGGVRAAVGRGSGGCDWPRTVDGKANRTRLNSSTVVRDMADLPFRLRR